MKETGIIMSGEHPKLILDEIKTQTRRVLRPQPDLGLDSFESYGHIEVGKYHPTLVDKNGEEYPGEEIFGAYTDDGEWGWKYPYGQVGDRLWVRETFWAMADGKTIYYKATVPFPNFPFSWKPSIHMPRWASRITLEITDVRVERLQEISPLDIVAEGYDSFGIPSGVFWFKELWDSINAKRGYGWEVNPWVWVISFRRLDGQT